MVQIASVDIGTKLDLSGFYRGLETLSSAKTPVIKVDIKYDAGGIGREKKQLEKLLNQQTTIRIKADHSELYELNRHIESKRTHVKELNLWMSQNPIRVKVDNSELKAAKVKERITSTAKKGTTEYKLKDTISDYSDIVDSIEDLNKTVSEGFKAQKKGVFSEIKTGFLENVGRGLNKTVTEIFSKITKNVVDVGKSYLGNIISSKKTKVTQESKTYSTKEKEERTQSEELKRQMLAMNRKQVLEPLAQKVGIKNARNLQGGKQKLVDELISKVALSDLKSRLPYVDNISQIAAQEGAKAIKQQSSVLIAGIQQSIKEYTSEFKQLKGTGSQPDIANLSNEIEGKYKEIIGILNSGLEADVRKTLEGAKLQLAKIRKAIGKEHADIATQVLSQREQKGVTQSQFLRRGQSFTPLQKRRLEQIEYNKRLVDERAEQLYKTLPDLPENTKRIALVSGGFAGKMGKSSKGIAQRMQPFLGDDTFVQPVENFDTDDDIDYDQPGLKKIKWFKHVGKIFLRHNLQKGYKEDALEAAAYAQALQKKAKSQGLEIPHIEGYGYSSGGYLMQEVAELSRGKIPFKGVGIGTPHYNVSNTASPDDYLSILGDQDPLWTLQGKKESPNLKRYQNAGKQHTLEKYLNNASVQKDIYQHMGRETPFILGNQFESSMMSAMETADEYLTMNPKMRPTFKALGSIDTLLEKITEHRQTIADQINNIPEEILEDVQAADEILLGLQNQLIRGFDIEGSKVEPLAKKSPVIKKVVEKKVQPPIDQGVEAAKKINQNVKLPDVKTNNNFSAYYGLSSAQAKQLDKNYKNAFKEVANISGFEIAGKELPGLHVDEKLLKEQSADALYDIQNNQIIISKELQKALSQTPQALSQYANQFQALVHEARHALQFDLGTLTMADLELGLKPGTKLKPFAQTSAFAQQSAKESLQYAKVANPLMTTKQDSVLATVEADAFDFENNTQDIIDSLIATDTFDHAFGDFKQEKLAFKKAMKDIEKLLGEGLNHLAKILTDFGKGLITKVQTSLTGFLTGNQTRKENNSGEYGFQYVRRGQRSTFKVTKQPDDIPDPWLDDEAEYRSVSVIPGTGGHQFAQKDPRTPTAQLKNQVRKRLIKPIVKNFEVIQEKAEKGIEDFNNRLDVYVQDNTKRILQEVAKMSNITFDKADTPRIVVNNSIAKTHGKQAIYDIQKNQIIVTRRIRDLLQSNPKVLEQFSQELKPIVEAAKQKLNTSVTTDEIEEFSKHTGEVFARVATTSKGERSNYPGMIKALADNLESFIDTLAVGKQESEKLREKASLYVGHLRQAAKTPDDIGVSTKAADYTVLGVGTKTKRGAVARVLESSPILESNNTLGRVFRAAIPKEFRQKITDSFQDLYQNALSKFKITPSKNVFEALNRSIKFITKKFDIPIELYAKLNIKGIADVVDQLQSIVGKQLDKLQEKAGALPLFGDLASKAVGGLKAFTVAGMGGVLVALRLFSVLTKFTALSALTAQVALVTVQFANLKKVFVSTASEGNRSAEAFERVMQGASKLRIDKTLATTGAIDIFGNVSKKMGGKFAENVNTRAQESVAIFAKDTQQAQQIYAAFDKLTQSSILGLQDFQSISSAIPGSLDIIARSMGMTSAEFENFAANNQILADELLPRLMRQMEIENQPKLAGYLETITAATNRYNNALLDMQLAVGDVLTPLEKFRLNTIAGALETVGQKGAEVFAKWGTTMAVLSLAKFSIAAKNLLATIIPIIVRLPLFQTGIVALTVVFKAILPIIGKMMYEFVLFQVAVDAAIVGFKAFQSAGGQFQTWADQSASNVEKVALAFDKATVSAESMKKVLPTNEKDLKQTGSRFEDTLVGSLLGKENTRWAESKLDKGLAYIPGYKTYAQKELYDKDYAVQQLVGSSGKNAQKVLELRGGQNTTFKEFSKIDQELESIKAKRRSLVTLAPGNVTQLRELKLQERSLLAKRDIKATPILQLQSAISGDIKGMEDALAKIDEESQKGAWTQEAYERATQSLKMGLIEAEKSQYWLNKQIRDGTTALVALKQGFAKLNAELTDTNTNLQTNYSQKLIAINKAVTEQTMTTGESQFAQMNSELELMTSQLSTNKSLALEMKESLEARGGEETLTNWGVDYKKTGAEEFGLLATRAEEKGNPKEQEIFTQYKRIKELDSESVNIELQLSQRKADYSKQLTELNKQITEYYISATRQFAESSLEAQRQTSNLKTQTYATNIRTSISGFQDNIVSQFAESVISSIEQLSEAADKQFDVESAALQANNAFEDSLKQGEELRKQLPGISTNGTIDIPAIPIELDLSKLGIDNSFIDITSAFNKSLSSAKDTIEDSTDSTNNLTEAFQGVTLGSIVFGDSVQQAVDNTDSGTIATQNLATELLNTTFTASDLGFAIDTNTDSLNANNDAVIATNDSLFGSIEATGIVTASTVNWGTETGNVHNVIEDGLKVALNSLPVCLQDIIKNTVDWFSTFANNIPILNSIGQIFNSWGQQLGSVSQSVASFGQSAIQNIGNVVQQGVGFVQNALGMGGDSPPVGDASQPVFPIAGVSYNQAQAKKTSAWGMRRHPVTGQMKMHRGQDFGFGEGTQVVSPMAGVVTGVKYQEGGAGKYVVVESLDEKGRKIEHKFFHLSAYDVKEGQRVNAGDKIGKVGSTGIGTGAHLHYETWINGQNVNPNDFLAGRNGRGLSTAQKGMIEQHHPGDGHDHGGENKGRSNQSSITINASQIANQYGLDSLLVQDIKSGQVLGSYNANQTPNSPASTIKLIAADLVHAAIKEKKLALDQNVTIAKEQVAEGSEIQAGQKLSIQELLTRMLRDSDNTSFNAIIKTLGGTEAATNQAQKRGFTGTQIHNYLSIPGANNAFSNISTPSDVTKAMRNLQVNTGGAADTARKALGEARNFGFTGEVGGKIGNNSRVTGNVGLANINGRQVIITAYKNQGDSPQNRQKITSASNEIVSQIGANSHASSPGIASPFVTRNGAPKLGQGYDALNELGGQLTQNKYFDPSTPEGRGRLAIALGIGGSEAFEKDTKRRAFYTYKGGTGNNMQGFGQFNNAYHNDIINTPEKYQTFFGQILTGERRLPNSQKGIGDYGAKVTEAVQSGQIRSGQDLIKWMQANKLGGSNWQGVDDGWKRNPGLADQLVQYLKGGLPTQGNTATNSNNISAPQSIQQIANTPIPTVWSPGSVNARGNAVINEVTGRAAQQRDRQIELARQKASNEAAQNTATALRNSNKAFIELERGLRENGIKVTSLGNQVTDTNLEYKGALDNEQKRQQEQRKLEEKYSELENNLVEQSKSIQAQVDTAKTLLSKGGIVSPEMKDKVQKLIDNPDIKDNLREQLKTALSTGVLGDDGRNILTRAVSEGEDQLKKLETGLSSVRSGRVESKKLLDERFAREEAVRKQQTGFDIESASLETLKAKLEQLQTLKEKTPFAPEVQGIPALEQVIKNREEQLNLEKQLKEIADKERDKTYTKEEADKLRTEVQARKKIVDATIAQKTEQAKIILQREQENRNREAANELAQSELASDKAKVEQLKLLAQTNPLAPELQNNAIGDLEQRIALREAELQLAQDLAAIEQQAIEGKRTPDEVSKLKAGKQDEYQKKIENIKTQGEQTAFANQISQEKTILSIKQQQLDYQKQVSDITTQAINLGLQQGDPLKLKFEIDKSELAVNVEKQILDMKEFARSTGKSQDEVATLEQQIRGLNAVSLGNLEAEFNKAITARATAIGQKVTESRVELLDSKASFYSNRGMTNEARGLQRESAILQQQNSYRNQKNDLEEFIKTNQVGAAEAANLRDSLEQVNQVKFDSIKDNFNAFKPVIDSAQSGLKNFFTGVIKGGQSIGDLFKGLMDSVLSSVAELASNFLVEKLFGGILGKGKNEGQGGMFAKGDSEGSSPLSPISNILGDGSDVGTSALTPMFVNVVNGDTLGGLGKGNGLTSIFGGKEDSSNNLTPSLFSGFTGKVDSANPVPVGIIKSAPDALSPITNVLGNVFGGKGGLGSIVSGIGSLFSGGSGKGGNGLGSILGSVGGLFGGGGGGLGGIIGIASSLLGGFFWEGGIVGNYAHGGLAEAIGRERDMNGGRAVAIAALTHGERVLNLSQTANLEKLGGIDILNFSDGGTVGYVPTKTEYGGSADKVTESKSQPRDVNVKLETQVINGVEYLTKSQGEELARKAAEQGAMQGARYVSDKLINSPSYRSTHGL